MRSLKAIAAACAVTALATCMPSAALASEHPLRIFTKAGHAQWRPVDFEYRDGMLILHLDPERAGAHQMHFLFNPPPGTDLNETNPPLLLGVKVDGRPVEAVADQYLGSAPEPPQTILFGVADRGNMLDLHSIRATIDGRPVDEVTLSVLSGREVRICVHIADVGPGKHALQLSVSDAAPQRNVLTTSVRFHTFDPTNYAAAGNGAIVTVDSSYPYTGYEILDCINDGVRYMPSSPAGAIHPFAHPSSEENVPHWVQMEFPELKTISEVAVYWCTIRDTCHRSLGAEVQLPHGNEWTTVEAKATYSAGENCLTTFTFAPVQVKKFRVWQPAGGGSKARPDLMYLVEVEAH